MNTEQLAMHDDNWHVAIHDQADALPVDAPDFTDAWTLGTLDAYDKLPCVPQQYYVDLLNCRQYARGHESVAGESLLSRQWTATRLPPWVRFADPDDPMNYYDEDAIEDDHDWIRQGGA